MDLDWNWPIGWSFVVHANSFSAQAEASPKAINLIESSNYRIKLIENAFRNQNLTFNFPQNLGSVWYKSSREYG